MPIVRDPIKKAYAPFKTRLSLKAFEKKVNALGKVNKWNFVRASFLYQQALKCEKCEPNIAMFLLCSAADTMKVAAGKNAGSHRNFKDFYMKYCRSNLRNSPIEYYPNAKPPLQAAPFGKSLDFIYAKFRCLYVHEGKGRLQPLPKGITWIGSFLLDKYRNEYFNVDTLKILNWFGNITLESLNNIL